MASPPVQLGRLRKTAFVSQDVRLGQGGVRRPLLAAVLRRGKGGEGGIYGAINNSIFFLAQALTYKSMKYMVKVKTELRLFRTLWRLLCHAATPILTCIPSRSCNTQLYTL